MRLTGILLMLTVLLAQDAWATPKVDSIKAFTGAARVKFVWQRTIYCNPDYSPVSSPTKALMLFDTDEGVERVLDKNPALQIYIRISRSGKWALWNQGTSTYIIDLTTPGATPKVFLSKANCTYWVARAVWIDPDTKVEYAFCLDNYDGSQFSGNGIVKVPFNADGTADVSKAVNIPYEGGSRVDDQIAVSQDGKKLAGGFPWPETKILDIPTGRLDYRHHDGFGCQVSLAPDNSYRLAHCEGDHYGIFMFAANMVDQNWYINLSHNLVLFEGKNGMDFGGHHWGNHPQFTCTNCPINDNWDYHDAGWYAGQTAAWIQANTKLYDCKRSTLHKFTADFTDIESSIAISADIRYEADGGDAWLSNGVTGSPPTFAAAPAVKARTPSPVQVSYAGGRIILSAKNDDLVRVNITDAQGKLVRRWNSPGAASLDAADLSPGVYCVSVISGERRIDRRISVKGGY